MFTHRIDDHIHLRLLDFHHAEALYTLTENNRQHLRKWLMWAEDIYSVSDSREFIMHGLKQYADNNGFQAGIWVDDALAGCIGFHRINWLDRNTEIGYWLGHAYTGRGVMTKAVRAVVNHAFNVWALHRVEIRCAEGNVKSRAIPERLGFHQDGIMRQEIWLHDRWVNHVVYSMLSHEWQP